MVQEIDIIKIKKGIIYAVTSIPVSHFEEISPIDLSPKACPKITATIHLVAGASLTIRIRGIHNFPTHDDIQYDVYYEVITESKVIEIPASYFRKFYMSWTTDASTTAQLYIFFEYDYDLIK